MDISLNSIKKVYKKNIKFFIIFFIALGIALSFLAGYFICYNKEENTTNKTERHESGYSYISPLLECYSEKSDSPENYKLKEQIEDTINSHIKNGEITSASIYFRDLANGPWFGINENEKFTPASLLKVPIMITYYKIAENNPDILDEKVIADWQDSDDTPQNIAPENKVEKGKTYTIQELINYMIIESDNHAATIILNKLPDNTLNKTFSDLGLNFPDVETPENYMTVKDYSSFFRVLYNASYLNKYYSEKSLEILSQAKYKDALAAGIPSNIKIAHKFGERRNMDLDQLHDCGIIYKKNKDYMLCVMTRGDDFSKLSGVIKDLSSLVYQNVK